MALSFLASLQASIQIANHGNLKFDLPPSLARDQDAHAPFLLPRSQFGL